MFGTVYNEYTQLKLIVSHLDAKLSLSLSFDSFFPTFYHLYRSK